MNKLSEQEIVRREKLQELIDNNIDPFGKRFDRTDNSKTVYDKFDKYDKEALHDMEMVPIKVAGRLMTIRGKGKVSFAHIMDQHGHIQL
ncbi:MAG: lysine--tRNA ligase, partial [Candidatus Izimaplasma sp.]|nr:lysine--tRNA ligase [Candidatus Izimaplasma bacterium]